MKLWIAEEPRVHNRVDESPPPRPASLDASLSPKNDERSCAARMAGDLSKKPYDRARLDVIASAALEGLPVLAVGAGSEQVAEYLARTNKRVIIVGEGTVTAVRSNVRGTAEEEARAHVERCASELSPLDVPTASAGGVVSYYGLVHLERRALPDALRELARVLKPSAPFLLALGRGEGSVSLEPDGRPPHATLYERAEICARLSEVGLFDDLRVESRRPYPGEAPFPRLFVTGCRTSPRYTG